MSGRLRWHCTGLGCLVSALCFWPRRWAAQAVICPVQVPCPRLRLRGSLRRREAINKFFVTSDYISSQERHGLTDTEQTRCMLVQD